ncbi:imv protein [Skunkpox virus]|uniref:Protein OPG157 n=1 Tax=Skunkpox virus TaxID=160796 RepID=A0A1C9KBW5_9POXV|nr:imv protein [Skunkpox virus]AOP31628.1 imv protein [Skunkpox virus]
MEDLDEANFSHLLINLSNNKDIDSQYSSTLSVIHELISAINFKIFNINKKSKKNSKSNDQHPVVHYGASSGREINRR